MRNEKMTNPSQEKWFSLADLILILVLVLAGILLSAWIFYPDHAEAAYVEVRQNGNVIMTLPLDKDTEKTITNNDGRTNTFHIREQSVVMDDADCGDKTCVNTGKISRTGESIVCLPHRLVLEIISERSTNDDAPDALVR